MSPVVRAVQIAISTLSGVFLKDDGIWGPKSIGAFRGLPSDLQQGIRDAVARFGYDPGFLDTEDESVVLEAIENAAEVVGLDFDFLVKVARIESNLNSKAINGRHRGLYQMSPAAWSEASDHLRELGVSDVRDYDFVFSSVDNALHGAAYLELSRERLGNRLGREPSEGLIYLAHQQGASGIGRILTGDVNQSLRRNMRNNTPPDGKGATDDPLEFSSRWLQVLARKGLDTGVNRPTDVQSLA